MRSSVLVGRGVHGVAWIPLAVGQRVAVTPTARVARGYDNCTSLNHDFKHGNSDRHMTKREWIRKGASGKGA